MTTQQFSQQPPPPGAYAYPPVAPAQQKGSGLAITALVLGIIAVLLCWIPIVNYVAVILGVIGLVFGVIGIFKSKRVMSIIGAALSLLAIVLSFVIMAVFVDAVDQAVNDMNASVAEASDIASGNASLEAEASANAAQAPVPAPAPGPALSAGQENALGSAEQYLGFSAFSRSGLIQQLEFEGYSTVDATWAVDNVTVDWNEQAAKSAEQYLDMSNFSRSGLIQQLEFEGFTPEQAAFGASQAGL